MTVSQAEQANRKVRRAQAALDSILEQAGDGTQARADLLTAQAELEAAQAAAQERAQADEQRIESEAIELTAAVSGAVAKTLTEIVSRIGPLPEARVDARWAQAVAKARRELAALRVEAEATRERLTGQQQRLASLKADRQTVIERRMQGDERDSDGAALALLDADIEGLTDLATRTESQLRKQEADLAEATSRHTQAEKRWATACDQAWCDALADLALIAEQVILEASDAMRVQGHDHKRWNPSVRFANLLHRKLAA
jgi:hypothetical protein